MAVNFASVLAQRKQNTVLLDLTGSLMTSPCSWGFAAIHAARSRRKSLAHGPDAIRRVRYARSARVLCGRACRCARTARYFTEHAFREFATFLVEKYDSIVIDGGRAISDEVVLAACQYRARYFW